MTIDNEQLNENQQQPTIRRREKKIQNKTKLVFHIFVNNVSP